MRTIKYDLEYSSFPVKLGLQAAPAWKRRKPAPRPGPGPRQRRSDKVDADAVKRAEQAQGNSDKGES